MAASWEDVTSLLQQAAGELAVGEMVHVPEFNLRDVMSAVEAMDPKVDGGFHLVTTRTLDELVASGEVLRSPSDDQAVEIIDHLLSCELTWYTGRSLPQTIFSSIYVQRLSLLQHPLLHAYLRATLLGVLSVARAVERVDIKEEEEFIPTTFAVLNLEELEQAAVIEALASATAELQQRVAAAAKDSAESKVATALLVRFQFRTEYLAALQYLDQSEEAVLPQAKAALARANDLLGKMFAHRTGAGRLLANAVPQPPEGSFTKLSTKWINAPSPIRDIDLLTWQQTEQASRKFLGDLLRVCDLPDYGSLPRQLQFLHSFSNRCALAPPRAYLHLYLRQYQFSLATRILESIERDYGIVLYSKLHALEPLPTPEAEGTKKKKGGKPQAGPVDPAAQLQEAKRLQLQVWLDRAAHVHWLLLHALCCNRSRLRRRLANLFPDLGAMQQAAWETDLLLGANEKYSQAYFLSHYTYDVIVQSMSLYLLLGFELDLYKHWEYQPMLWYLDFLGRSRLDAHPLLYKAESETEKQQQNQPRGGRGAKPRRKVTDPNEPEVLATRRHVTPPTTTACIIECYSVLTRGLFRFLAALVKDNIEIAPPANQLGSQSLTYEHRLLPFLHLTRPQYVRWDTYNVHSDTSAYPSDNLLDSAIELFGKCKYVIEHNLLLRSCTTEEQEELNRLSRVAKGNLLAAQLYKQLRTTPEVQLYLDPDYTIAQTLPVLKLKKGPPPKIDRDE